MGAQRHGFSTCTGFRQIGWPAAVNRTVFSTLQGTPSKETSVFFRSRLLLVAAASAGLIGSTALAPSAHAIGCISGGAAGAVAGHYAHHHTVLGAVGGCIAGHEAHKHFERERAERDREHRLQEQGRD
jgi:hypothetical protein